jgi:glycerol kinase
VPNKSGTDAFVVAVDQGTSSTKAVVVDASGRTVSTASVPLALQHPQAGWVEQDATEILDSVTTAITQALASVDGRVATVGLSTQRESAVIWDTRTGKPLGPVLGWQDRRTADSARKLNDAGHGDQVQRTTGLPIDPMFSALNFAWLLDQVDPDRSKSAAGEIALGTVDAWLVFRLTGEHRIEVGNASRTLLLDVTSGHWDDDMLALFGVPRAALPRVAHSNEPTAPVVGVPALGEGVTIGAVLADSHAALFGHGVREPGTVKVTYGTGSSVLGLLDQGAQVGNGLVRTIAWSFGTPVLASEGNILSTGATLVWLADLLSLTPDDLAALALSVEDSHGVTVVPAFAGLGAPWWDEAAQGLVTGITLGATAAHFAYAAFESIAFQIEDVLAAMDQSLPDDAGVRQILADGGPSSNAWRMQLQADLSQRSVRASAAAGVSALGAAYLAGCTAQLWTDAQVVAFARSGDEVEPQISAHDASARRARWLEAVARSRGTSTSHAAQETSALHQ